MRLGARPCGFTVIRATRRRSFAAGRSAAAYTAAWQEWETSGDAGAWESTAARLGRGVVTVVPITGNTTRVFAFQGLLPAAETGIHVDSKAQAEQVRSVSVERLGPVIGRLPTNLTAQLDDALRLHLLL